MSSGEKADSFDGAAALVLPERPARVEPWEDVGAWLWQTPCVSSSLAYSCFSSVAFTLSAAFVTRRPFSAALYGLGAFTVTGPLTWQLCKYRRRKKKEAIFEMMTKQSVPVDPVTLKPLAPSQPQTKIDSPAEDAKPADAPPAAPAARGK